MKYKFALLATMVLLTFCVSTSAWSQWVQTAGFRGGEISSLTNENGVIYASSIDGAIFRSTDTVKSWSRRGTLISDSHFESSRSVALVNASGLYRSSDGWVTWTKTVPDTLDPEANAIGANDSTLFIANSEGVFRSLDGAVTWTRILSSYRPALAVSGNSIYVVIEADAPYGGVFRSMDNGDSWKHLDTTFSKRGIQIFSPVSNLLFAETSDKDYYRSDDSGLTWVLLNTGFSSTVQAMCSDGPYLYAAIFDSGLYRSSDNGTRWSRVNLDQISIRINDVCSLGSATLVATNMGVKLSTDHGNTWVEVDSGLNAIGANSLLCSGNRVFAAMPSGLYGSSNHGISWKRAQGSVGDRDAYYLLSRDSVVFVQSDAPFITDVTALYRSTNDGASWDSLGLDGGNLAANSTGLLQSGGLGSDLYRSTDDGIDWVQLDSAATAYGTRSRFEGAILGDSLLIASLDSGATYPFISLISSDFGNTWTDFPKADSDMILLAINGSTIFSETYPPSPLDTGIYRSKDKGLTWQLLLGTGSVSVFAVKGNILLAVSSTQGVMLSTDQGNSWATKNDGLPSFDIRPIAMGDSEIFVGLQSDGIYRLALPTSSGVTSILDQQDHLAAHPNPLSASTSIRVSSKVRAVAQVFIVNLLGQEVARLFSGELNAGEHSFTWDAQGMPAGTYVCVVRRGGDTQELPIVLVR